MVGAMLEIDKDVYGKYMSYTEITVKTHVRPPQKGGVRNTKGGTPII